jgi:hypothetical protein
MRKLSLLTVLLFFCALVNAQSTVKGTIVDTSSKINLENTVVTLLHTDSVMYNFTRTNTNGVFEMKDVKPGKYIIMITKNNYADYTDAITVTNEPVDFGKLPLITKAKLLEDVIVKQSIAAIRIKGDTTEYRADSFRVGPNSNVQELLRKLPGISVNAKGEISAQGQKVEKVLVDGEEFFSDDPAVVTQNLRADAVEKVQVYDKKSDQATFTGIDDGQKSKTINLTLKENAKRGYFGKIEAGTDFNDYRSGKAMINVFRGKKKFAAYATTDNTRYESLDWNEKTNYSTDLNRTTTINDDGSMMMYSQSDDFSWGTGFPSSVTAGAVFNSKWNKDKHSINNTFQYNDLDVNNISTSYNKVLLKDSFYVTNSLTNGATEKKRKRLNTIYEWQIDSTSSLKLTARATQTDTYSNMKTNGNSYTDDNELINETLRNTVSNTQTKNVNANIFWRKRFKKIGRTMSFNSDIVYDDRDNAGYLVADNKFYNLNGTLKRQDLLDQMKKDDQVKTDLSGRLSYTEPLWKKTFLELYYRFGVSKNDAERNTYVKPVNSGKYDAIVDTLSNHFLYDAINHAGGFTFRLNEKKFNFSAGTGLGRAHYEMTDMKTNSFRSVDFTNFLPTATFGYNPKKQTRLNLNYNGNTRNPSLQQIQPIRDNSDPLNVYIGNPLLKQEFQHNLSINFSDYKVLKSRSWWISGSVRKVENAITNYNTIDTEGKRTNQYVNINGNYGGNAFVSYGFEPAPSLNLNFNLNLGFSRNNNFVNGYQNVNNNKNLGIGMYGGYWKEGWINFWLNIDATYNTATSSLNPASKTNYWQLNSYPNVNLKFKKLKFYVDLNSQVNVYEKTGVFKNARDIFLVNATLRKTFLKTEVLEAKVYFNDIFNQNFNVQRNITTNFISETTNQSIQRYTMFSLVYHLNKKAAPQNNF